MSSDLPRVLVVVGTRPEAIKMAPVVRALRERNAEATTLLALTGQHTDLVDQALEAFSLEPDHDLAIMRPDQSLYEVAHACMDGMRDLVRAIRPDVLLVQGDTATVCFASLVGFLERVRVGHVEAGLRSGDKWSPFPEEIFRRITDTLSDQYFAPTPAAAANLEREGVPAERVHVTGNTVVDSLLEIAARERPFRDPVLGRATGAGRRLVLLTAHRRESFGAPLTAIFGAVRALADSVDDVEVVYPVHPNPNVREPAVKLLSDHPRIHLTGPVDYLDLVRALRDADLVLTDSGGIQEEAPAFGTPVLVLREVTERPEGIEAGVAELVGTDPDLILARARHHLARGRASTPPANPYGDGRAGERVADIVLSDLLGTPRRTTDWTP
ncbi:MAG TPA: UDP-N-acetylglucosamine 2-epimerase (non-hydrolyzing) [Longimicrobiales bacterium]|jgi:UDP-N-acetylglucosamine 2-epimerase (non-hydrolysing)